MKNDTYEARLKADIRDAIAAADTCENPHAFVFGWLLASAGVSGGAEMKRFSDAIAAKKGATR